MLPESAAPLRTWSDGWDPLLRTNKKNSNNKRNIIDKFEQVISMDCLFGKMCRCYHNTTVTV